MSIAAVSLRPAEPAPKHVKFLGVKVAEVGTITAVAAERFDLFVLITRPDGTEAHAFVVDLDRAALTVPAEVPTFHLIKRRIGYGLWGDMYEIVTVPFSDLTHIDVLEAAA